jgi:hypothetical protein
MFRRKILLPSSGLKRKSSKKTVLYGVTAMENSLFNILRCSHNSSWSQIVFSDLSVSCIFLEFFSSSQRQSVSTDIVVGRLPVTLANQYFSLDGVRCRQSCASYTSHLYQRMPFAFMLPVLHMVLTGHVFTAGCYKTMLLATFRSSFLKSLFLYLFFGIYEEEKTQHHRA